jgi:hypothetical protein
MSIQTMKKKGVAQYGNKVSGKSPGGEWINKETATAYSPNGFSINGGSSRSGSYIGKTYKFSKVVTPYLGRFPRDFVINPKIEIIPGTPAQVRCIQRYYIKPSVVSSMGMLNKKYQCCPTIVQNTYPSGPMDLNASASSLTEKRKYACNLDEPKLDCLFNPVGEKKPFPFHTNTSSSSKSTCKKCPHITAVYYSPPSWYL